MESPTRAAAIDRAVLTSLRLALWFTAFGYGLDYTLSHFLLVSVGTGESIRLHWSHLSESPFHLTGALSVLLLTLGHLCLIGGAFAALARSQKDKTLIPVEKKTRFHLLVGSVGVSGLLTLYLKEPIVVEFSFTYIETMGLDLIGLLGLSIFCLYEGWPSTDLTARARLREMAVATVVVQVTVFADSKEAPWLMFFFVTGFVWVLLRAGQLLEQFEQPSKPESAEEPSI